MSLFLQFNNLESCYMVFASSDVVNDLCSGDIGKERNHKNDNPILRDFQQILISSQLGVLHLITFPTLCFILSGIQLGE